MFIIIQHLCIRIESDTIGAQVHKAMHKQNSWTSTKTTKDIKIINKILLPYYYNIFGSSFGYGIFTIFRYAKERFDAAEQAVISLGTRPLLGLV